MPTQITRVLVRQIIADGILVEPVDRGCGRCDEPGGCGGVNVLCGSTRLFRAEDSLGSTEGELVDVSIDGGHLAVLITSTYVMPLLGLLVGALSVSSENTFYGVIGAGCGFFVGYLSGRYMLGRQNLRLPQVVKRYGKHLEV